MLSVKQFTSALAAVLVAAAFVVSCIFAPVAYAVNTYTSSVVVDASDQLISNYSLTTPDVQSALFCSYADPDLFNVRYMVNPTVTVNDDSVSYYGTCFTRQLNSYNGRVNYEQATRRITVYSDRVTIQTASSAYETFYADDSKTRYLIGLSVPSSGLSDSPIEGIKRSLELNRQDNGRFGFFGGSPTLDTPVSGADFYSSHIKPTLQIDISTTTTTTTTTTTITTTTTTVTLPPYPYETSPPFTLPDDWTADYSETTPVPDVDYQPPTVDFQPAEIPEEVMSGVGFWFTIFTDFWQQFHLTWVVLLVVGLGFLVYLLWG